MNKEKTFIPLTPKNTSTTEYFFSFYLISIVNTTFFCLFIQLKQCHQVSGNDRNVCDPDSFILLANLGLMFITIFNNLKFF